MKDILHLIDLPEIETSILFKKEYKKDLFQYLFRHFLNFSRMGKDLGIKSYLLKNWKNQDYYIQLKYIIKISKFLSAYDNTFSMQEIEKNIFGFKYTGGKPIFNPKFPINLESEEGAIIAAAFLCDGGITNRKVPIYNNSEECMRKKVVNAVNKLIGDSQVNPANPYENNCIFFPKALYIILKSGFNMDMGNKVINDPKIPDIFINSNKKEVMGAFLNQAFSDDGTAYIDKRYQGCLAFGTSVNVSIYDEELRTKIEKNKLTQYAPELVRGCKLLLEKLEIKVNGPYLKGKYVRSKTDSKMAYIWGIQIQGRKNILEFKRNVGFSIEKKNQIVEEILKNYKEVDYRTSFKDAWEKVVELEKENKAINTKTFMEKRKCTLENARFLLNWLRKEGILQRKGGGNKKGIWGATPYEYKLIKPIIEDADFQALSSSQQSFSSPKPPALLLFP